MAPSKQVHRISVADPAAGDLVRALLTELRNSTIRSRTPIGDAVSFLVSDWRREPSGDFLVQFSPLAAARLDAGLSGVELLRTARALVGTTSCPDGGHTR